MRIGCHVHLAVLPFSAACFPVVIDNPKLHPLGQFSMISDYESTLMVGEQQAQAHLRVHQHRQTRLCPLIPHAPVHVRLVSATQNQS